MSSFEISVLFFLQLAVILGVCRAVGWVAKYFGQPQVVAEMIAGVLMGPNPKQGSILSAKWGLCCTCF
jgi:Kef-type K+ transport system membrane component KefB